MRCTQFVYTTKITIERGNILGRFTKNIVLYLTSTTEKG